MSLPEPIRPALQCVVYNAPFLAHLVMALRWRMDESIQTACTNGVEVRVNPHFFAELNLHERAGLLAHEALHCALRHSARAVRLVKNASDAGRFNAAADAIVNGAIEKAGLTLPKGAIRDRAREHMSVEELYRLLKDGTRSSKLGKLLGARLRDLDIEGAAAAVAAAGASEDDATIDWPSVIRRADILARKYGGNQAGSDALDIARELSIAMGEPQVDWRSVLHRFLADCPNDWGKWDRRAVHRGVYIPTLVGRRLRAVVGIDVSGSISDAMLKIFFTELQGILRATDNLEVDLFWTDTRIHGPERLTQATDISTLKSKGGGGTDLGPLFLEAETIANDEGLIYLPTIYLTDGYGQTLPKEPSNVSALWVIPADCNLNQPWGTVVPMEASP
jgi:predicted metal-dependent peptidase